MHYLLLSLVNINISNCEPLDYYSGWQEFFLSGLLILARYPFVPTQGRACVCACLLESERLHPAVSPGLADPSLLPMIPGGTGRAASRCAT